MFTGGYLKLFRKITNWGWYYDVYVKHVFLDLLLKANYKDKEWHGIIIKRGQFLTSRRHYAEELHISEQKLRGILKKLELTNEIKVETTQKYTLITIINYESYQDEKEIEEQPTSNPQNDPQITQETTQKITHEIIGQNLKKTTINESNNQIITQQTTQTMPNKQPTNIAKSNHNIRNNNINNNKLNYTTLNLLFNYLINKEQKFENLNDNDKIVIVNVLKRLEIYVTSQKSIPESMLYDLKLQYWTIKELYLSPYKLYLDKLTNKKFMFRFLKTKQYIKCDSEEKIGDFISYFIKSLREDLEKTNE